MSDEAQAIGIDLGTTNSCAAVVKDDKIILIHGEDGRTTTASFVYFEGSGCRLVGNLAKDQAKFNIKNGIFGVKRFIGSTYDDFKKEKCMSMFPYVVENKNNKPVIVVKCGNDVKRYYPEEISAMVLGKLKERAEQVLGKKVTKAVITVPAHFNGTQRQATIDAGKIAGLEVLRIINEPTAAILAFELNNKYKNRSCNVLVYDFGGGTFDVSIATIHDEKITMKASNGEAFLGGDDLNNNLIEYFLQHFLTEYNIDLKSSKAYERLRNQAEKTKILLSSLPEHTARVDCIDTNNDIDFECRVTRTLFQRMNITLFEKTLECIENTLKDANMNKEDIDEILLVGGSTRIPYVTDLVKNYFNKEPNTSIHPDEAVAIGAARQAAISSSGNNICMALTKVKLFDVCSLSLGIDTKGGLMSIIIPRNTKLPTSKTEEYQTSVDYQENVAIDIYEGERPCTIDNKLLTKTILLGIRSALKGKVQIDVTFNIDENGILTVDAKEVGAKNSTKIEVNVLKNNLDEKEIENMIRNAKKFEEDDKKKKELTIYRNTLEDKHYDLNMRLQKILDPVEKALVLTIYKDITYWLKENKNPSLSDLKLRIALIEKYL